MKCLLSVLISWCTAMELKAQDDAVDVTYSAVHRKNKSFDKARMQFLPHDSTVSIWGFNLSRLPRNLRQIKTLADNQKLLRKQIQESANASLDSIYNLVQDTTFGFSLQVPAKPDYMRLKSRFLEGSSGGGYIKNQWIKLGDFSAVENGTLPGSIRSKGFLWKQYSFYTESLPAGYAGELPELENGACVPIDLEFIKLRKAEGYGVKNLKYQPYQMQARQIIRKSFEIYFDVNEARPYPDGLNAVISYLKQNDYVILGAEVEGGYSIEGSVQRNEQLKQARATVLATALKKYSRAKVKKDTILFRSPFELFREQIRKSSYAWMDSLTNADIRDTINADRELRAQLEPYLQVQRHAVLKLAMARPISKDEQVLKIVKELNKLSRDYFRSAKVMADTEGKMVGRVEALFDFYKEGQLTDGDLDSLLLMSDYSGLTSALTGYYLLSRYEKLSHSARDQQTWKKEWIELGYDYWIVRGNQAMVDLTQQPEARLYTGKLMKMLADYQSYSFEFINKGFMRADALCYIHYPKDSRFWLLAINDYSFLYWKEKNEEVDVPCLTFPESRHFMGDDTVDLRKFVAVQDLKPVPVRYRKFGNGLYKSPSYDTELKSPMYLMMKKYLMQKSGDNQWYVRPIKNEMLPFHLALFLETQLSNWNAAENHFYDMEIRLQEMDNMVARLKSIDNRICRADVVSLYLWYHLNALHYLESYAVPGNASHTKIADQSLRYISDYYTKQAPYLPSEFVLYLIKQFNAFNWLPGTKPGAWYGYGVLKNVARYRVLSHAELDILARYIRMFDPDRKEKYGKLVDLDLAKRSENQ